MWNISVLLLYMHRWLTRANNAMWKTALAVWDPAAEAKEYRWCFESERRYDHVYGCLDVPAQYHVVSQRVSWTLTSSEVFLICASILQSLNCCMSYKLSQKLVFCFFEQCFFSESTLASRDNIIWLFVQQCLCITQRFSVLTHLVDIDFSPP